MKFEDNNLCIIISTTRVHQSTVVLCISTRLCPILLHKHLSTGYCLLLFTLRANSITSCKKATCTLKSHDILDASDFLSLLWANHKLNTLKSQYSAGP